MAGKMVMMTSEELVAEVERWIEAREKEALEMYRKEEPGADFLNEAVAVCAGVLELFKMCEFATCQELCVMVLQTMMLGPEPVRKLTALVNGLNAGDYVMVATKNVAALIGPPAGRA